MTARDAIKLAKRVEFWQKELSFLGLGHWRIDGVSVVDEVPDSPFSVACVQTARQYDNFRLFFQTDYVENAEDDDIDETIIHELLHVAMRGLDRTYETVENYMPKAAFEDYMNGVLLEREAFIERAARTIYQMYAREAGNGWRQPQPR